MTGEAGPSDLPGQSRVPFSCRLEEHVRYSDGRERQVPCHIPLFPPTSWTRKEGGIELANVFYKTESGDSETTRADQEIVDVILSGRVRFHVLFFSASFFPNSFLSLSRPNITSSPRGSSRAACASRTVWSCSSANLCVSSASLSETSVFCFLTDCSSMEDFHVFRFMPVTVSFYSDAVLFC